MAPSSTSKCLTLALCLFGAALTMGASCLDPCEQLAQKICSCLPTAGERDSCTREASIQKGQHQPTQDDRLLCTQKLSQCECRDIKAGDIQECGLSRE